MLFKTILASLVLVGAAIAAPKPSVEPDVPSQVPQQGMWADGTTLYWLCQPGMKGSVKIMIVAPNGTQYPAEIECLSSSAKQI